jgi:PKD repeat protein
MTYSWQASNSLFVPSFSNPTISPTTSGTYYLTVTNGSGNCQSTDSVVIGIDVIPTFNIVATPTKPCQNNQITVSCTPTNLTNYVFSFGGLNNPIGSGAGPYLVSWSDTGKHCITATAKTAFGCAVSSATPSTCIRVINCLAPIPSFVPPAQPICEGATVSFIDATQNNPTSWVWTFISPDTINYPANPKFSSLQNPNVTLPKPGKYYIYLNAYNQAGPASQIYRDSIIVYYTPTATFGAISPVCQNYSTYLTYTGNASTTANYNWTFGGGAATGTGQGPIGVKYNLPGTKQLTLQVVENGCPSPTEATSVNVIATPVAAFGFNSIGPNYSFINKSSGASTYSWSFGDGQTSTTQHPIHSYITNGTFQVTLIAVKGNCSDDTTMAITAIVNGVDEANENKLFLAYHDKTTNNLMIKWMNNLAINKHIEILNMNGQTVYKTESKAEQINISTNDFTKGIYVVKCIDENGNAASKKWLKD